MSTRPNDKITLVRLALALLLCVGGVDAALATPARIIIVRHGEKADARNLCEVGQMRANALAATYLGRNATSSLFVRGEEPAAILANTVHSQELAAPVAATWGKQLTLYPVVHRKGENDEAFENALNVSTQNAAHDVLREPRYAGKTVVMVWEHKHIANKKLERAFSEEKVTLRQLLNLDQLEGVPKTWPSGTYDYFWIVEYGNQGSDVPTRFSMVKQEFGPPYGALPANDWDQPNGLEPESGCDLKGAQD